jgi:hypothetical protein
MNERLLERMVRLLEQNQSQLVKHGERATRGCDN